MARRFETVEEALNALLDAEADRLCGAARYGRSESRQDKRAGSYDRSLHTKAGEVKLKVPSIPSVSTVARSLSLGVVCAVSSNADDAAKV